MGVGVTFPSKHTGVRLVNDIGTFLKTKLGSPRIALENLNLGSLI